MVHPPLFENHLKTLALRSIVQDLGAILGWAGRNMLLNNLNKGQFTWSLVLCYNNLLLAKWSN